MDKKIRPQDKWNAKAGYVSRSYKLKNDVAVEFKETCERIGVSQAGQLTKMMKQFIDDNK